MDEFFIWLDKTLNGLGYELVDFEWRPGGLIRVFIDSPQGVNVDDCAIVSRHLSKAFLVKEVDYSSLEVSSPGLDRVLKKPADFPRFLNQEIKVSFSGPVTIDEHKLPKHVSGRLLEYDAEKNEIKLEINDVVLAISVERTKKIRLVPHFKWFS